MVNAALAEKLTLDRQRAVLSLSSAVKTLRHHLLLRVAVVALLMVSWVLFTNHCALGMMEPTAQAAKNSELCCGGKTGPKHGSPDSLRTCCNIKVTTAPAKAEVTIDTLKFAVQVFVVVPFLTAQEQELRCAGRFFDHGPPRCLSFAESVLQRSLLSHAPPFAV